MISLHAISSVPKKPPDNPSIIHFIFLFFSSIVHNTLHIPAYALLAGICYRCRFRTVLPYFNYRIKMILILRMAAIYGALLKWYPTGISGWYTSFVDITFNLIGMVVGIWLPRMGTAINKNHLIYSPPFDKAARYREIMVSMRVTMYLPSQKVFWQ